MVTLTPVDHDPFAPGIQPVPGPTPLDAAGMKASPTFSSIAPGVTEQTDAANALAAAEAARGNTSTLKPYVPSSRDEAGAWMIEKGMDPRTAQLITGSRGAGTSAMSVADLTPVGAAFGLEEGLRPEASGLETTLGIAGAIPIPGLAAGTRAVKAALKGGKDVAKNIPFPQVEEAIANLPQARAPDVDLPPVKTPDADLPPAREPKRKTITVKGEERYVGAPPGINTPEAEEKLIQSLMDKAKEGREGAGFYTDFQSEIRRNTQDPMMAQRFTSASGTTSQDATPSSNTTWALKAMNQQAVGAPFNTGRYPNANRAKLEATMPTGDLPAEDPKAGQYGINLLPEEMRPPEAPFIARSGFETYDRPVNDQHMFAAFGYPEKTQGGANIARHKYMDRITAEVSARLNAEEAAAAVKAKSPGIGHNQGPPLEPFWDNETTQASIWKTQRSTSKKGQQRDPSISELMMERKGFTQMGVIPGRTTGVDPKLIDASPKTLEKYVEHMVAAITDEGGGSTIARALGFSTPMRPGYGPWKGKMEPNRLIDFSMGSEGGAAEKVTDAASEEAAKAMRQWHQLGFGQEAAGFTTPYGPGTTRATGELARIDGFKLKTQADYDRAYALAKQTFGPDWEKRVVIMPSLDDGESLFIKNISPFDENVVTMTNPEFLEQAASFGKASPARDLSGQFDDLRWDNPEYRQLLEGARNNPALNDLFVEKIIPEYAKIQKAADAWAKKTGISSDTVIDRLRVILVKGGANWAQAVDDAVKKGTIPAIAGIIALKALTADSMSGGEGPKKDNGLTREPGKQSNALMEQGA